MKENLEKKNIFVICLTHVLNIICCVEKTGTVCEVSCSNISSQKALSFDTINTFSEN